MLFPRFTDKKPWGKQANLFQNNDDDDDDDNDDDEPISIPIYRLCHVTHEVEARNIQGDSRFTFIPRQKLGKAYEYDGSPLGTTYKEIGANSYEIIPRSEANPVFPGYWSWWGIDTSKWMINDSDGKEFAKVVQENRDDRCYAPSYLAITPGSSYGNKAFSMTLKDIFKDYKRSRNDRRREKVCLKGGGTLRYRNEICYVVLVCMKGDDLGDMRTFSIAKKRTVQFDPNGLVNRHGMIVAPPIFKPQSIVKSKINDCGDYDHYDWENLVFCFYFPREDQRLTCTNVEVDDIAHGPQYCSATISVGGETKCPNELRRRKVL